MAKYTMSLFVTGLEVYGDAERQDKPVATKFQLQFVPPICAYNRPATKPPMTEVKAKITIKLVYIAPPLFG